MRRSVFLIVGMMLAACSDPMDQVTTYAEADVAEDAPVLGAVPQNIPEAQTPGGLLAKLLSGDDTTDPAPAAPQPEPGETQAQQASLTEPEARAAPQARRGLFGGKRSTRSAALSEVEPGTVLPYGRVARICSLPKRQMGTQIAQYPENRPRHALYDSAPGSAGPRSFYLTGFDDGCARQFTAALAVFGSVGMHEQLRYGLPAEAHPYSHTDKAYETLKSRICRVPRKQPCGKRISKLESDTVFLSIYERFGGNSRWTNLLLHDGDVLAQDLKGN